MSEALDKVSNLRALPIFPLPLVLLPNEVLPLHIFEPRYRQMLEDIKTTGNIFGITYHDGEAQFGGAPEVGSVGCAAEIRESRPMPDGRTNIIVFGLARYEITGFIDGETPYLLGLPDFFEDDAVAAETLKILADDVYKTFDRVARAAFKLSGGRGRYPEVPRNDAESLSFLVAAALNLDNELKYSMLKTRSTAERLGRLRSILNKAVGQMEQSADIHAAAQTNGHSKKKLDF